MEAEIKVSEHIPWQHVFLVKAAQDSHSSGAYSTNQNIRKKINEWCENNCQSQWLITDKSKITLYANPQVEIPTRSRKYEPCYVQLEDGFIVMLENEEEATAFKLQFFTA